MNKQPIIPADPSDEYDFDADAQALDRAQKARAVRKARSVTCLSQAAFAERFRIPLGTLRDWEQARVTPPAYALAYLRTIERQPDAVVAAIGA